MTIFLEYAVATLGLLTGAFGSIFFSMFVLRIDMHSLPFNWPLIIALLFCTAMGAPFALWLYKKRQGETFRLWPVAKWGSLGHLAAGLYIFLLQSAGLLSGYTAFAMNLIPGIFTVWAYRKVKRNFPVLVDIKEF